jgi:uncharacterized protein YjbI with pentapeptide repeats
MAHSITPPPSMPRRLCPKKTLEMQDPDGARKGKGRARCVYSATLSCASLVTRRRLTRECFWLGAGNQRGVGSHHQSVCKIEQAKFEQAKFERAIFEQSKLEQAIFEQAIFEPAKFEPAKFEQAKFEQAIFEQAKFEQPKFDTKLDQAK